MFYLKYVFCCFYELESIRAIFQINRWIVIKMDRMIVRKRERQIEIYIEIYIETQIETKIERQIEAQIEIQIETQIDRYIDRKIERMIYRNIEVKKKNNRKQIVLSL